MANGPMTWFGEPLRRHGEPSGHPRCCCEGNLCCPLEPSGIEVDFTNICSGTVENPIVAVRGAVENRWEGALETSSGCGDGLGTGGANWDIYIWCDCVSGIYYLEMDGTSNDGYGTPVSCGPIAHHSKVCSPFRIEWRFDCDDCCSGTTLIVVGTPEAGSSLLNYSCP